MGVDVGVRRTGRSTPGPLRVPAGKTSIPELPAEFTPRRPLRRLLEQAAPEQVIVVSAPAGSGKTLLLADWVRESDWLETAWVSLDRDDNEAPRLWSAVVGALLALPSAASDPGLQRLAGGRGDGADRRRRRPRRRPGRPRPALRLVLDDVHELTGQEVLRDLAGWSAAAPPSCPWSSPAAPTRRSPCRACGWRDGCTRSGRTRCASPPRTQPRCWRPPDWS